MNAEKFFDRVAYLRKLQKQYFKTRDTKVLQKCRKVEVEIDTEIERVQAIRKKMQATNQPQQLNLF
jgi:hypothetical protein